MSSMNEIINTLNMKISAYEKIIGEQALEIAKLKEEKSKTIEFVQEYCNGIYDSYDQKILELLGGEYVPSENKDKI